MVLTYGCYWQQLCIYKHKKYFPYLYNVLVLFADILDMIEENDGYRTYKDLAHNQLPSERIPEMLAVRAKFLSFMIGIPVIGHLLQRSFVVIHIVLGYLRSQSDYSRLYKLLIDCLSRSTFRKKQVYRWWYLMRFAVASIQERQINWLIRDTRLENHFILLGNLGPRPLKGYDVAYSFVGYSLWLFERGDISSAVTMIKIAEQADETWGYPEYLHGWYGLFTTGINSADHFTRAVHIDWSFLQRMKRDRACRAHPEILHEVQRRTLVSK